jgi:hypothetical protein
MSRVWPRPVSSAPSDALMLDGVGALSKSFMIQSSYLAIISLYYVEKPQVLVFIYLTITIVFFVCILYSLRPLKLKAGEYVRKSFV